jgi:hypothetical protein
MASKAIYCDKCGKRMVTAKILELHLIKMHGGANEEVKTVIRPEDVKPVEVFPNTAVTPVDLVGEGVPEGMVEIISADGRTLEVSIGKDTWNGKIIFVPKEQVEDVKGLLEKGGFFLKN